MITNLNDFFELTKVLGFSIVVMFTGAVIITIYLDKWLGIHYCEDCMKELKNPSAKENKK